MPPQAQWLPNLHHQVSLLSSLFLMHLALSSSSSSSSSRSLNISSHGFSVKEATVPELQLAFKQNRLTSRQLVEFYLGEIHRINPVLRGVIEVNPDALHSADKADRERKAKASSSLLCLHGIPILVKDNIATKDKTNRTAGSFALLGSTVPRNAFVVTKLIEAGAIILGKASLSEWANARLIPNGWCARSGQGRASAHYYNNIIFSIDFTITCLPVTSRLMINVVKCDCRILMFCQLILVGRAVDQQYQ
ncbi:hypothetical protein LWI28_012783 [Acer negundo]|uniref:Amidase domain-containing protein n=1 Tax=Acer negundo TaxID=4023 RepID=A0AAD5IZ58_ACENE|nr:hypothetical protein LWI28_012783 [Acer negundo]